MKRIVAVSVFVVTVGLLSGCGLFDVELPDPFGLHDEFVTLTVGGGSSPILSPLQDSVTASGEFTTTFGDVSEARGTVSNTISVQGTARVFASGEYPETITVDQVSFQLRLFDAQDEVNDSGTISQPFTMSRPEGCVTGAELCDYTLNTIPDGIKISVGVGTVLDNGVEDNTADLTVDAVLQSEPSLQAGDSIRFRLEANEGSINVL